MTCVQISWAGAWDDRLSGNMCQGGVSQTLSLFSFSIHNPQWRRQSAITLYFWSFSTKFTNNHLAAFLDVVMENLPVYLPQHDWNSNHSVRIKIGKNDARAMITSCWGILWRRARSRRTTFVSLLSTTAPMLVFRYVFLLASKSFVICRVASTTLNVEFGDVNC